MTNSIVRTTRVFTRPNINIPWYHDIHKSAITYLKFENRLFMEYLVTGKIIDRVFDYTDTTLTVVIEWNSIESMNQHYSDPITIAHFADRDEYNSINGIETSLTLS